MSERQTLQLIGEMLELHLQDDLYYFCPFEV
jgi:hypothetical protein